MNGPLNWIASAIWSTVSGLARRFLRKRSRLPARVVSVGNIQVGGAGKTPLVARIAREAAERGLNACILCRGYGGEWERTGGVIAPGELAPPAAVCGDEALLLHELAPLAWIGVGADRARQFGKAQARSVTAFDLVILDDGFQGHRLARDIDIVAITSAGRTERIFRDWPRALRSAQLLVWTKGDRMPDARFAAPEVPCVRASFRLSEASVSRAVCLITGLADGEFARRSAEAAGYQVAQHISFPDHARYAETVMQPLLERVGRQGLQLMVTGKDWVKLRELPSMAGIRSRVLVIEPEVVMDPEDAKVWNRVLWGQ